MREQKVHTFWIAKGKVATEEQQEKINYEGQISVLSIELDSFLTSIYDGTSEIIKFKYLGYHFEEIYTEDEVAEKMVEFENEIEELKGKMENAQGFIDNVISHIDDLKSSISDLDYYCDEAIEDCDYANEELN